MNQEERQLLAAEYVLGTLPPEDRQSFVTALAEDAALQELVEDWQQRLTRLDETSAGIAPPSRVWDAINAEIDREVGAAAPRGRVVRAAARRWRPLAPGIEWVMLHSEPGRRQTSALIRMAPGARLRAHGHPSAEESLLLEGDLQIGDQNYAAGDFMVVPAGSQHPELVSESGCIAYIRGDFSDML